MRAGQDMAAARKRWHAIARTRKVVGLLETAPPLWESDRYAIAQALAELVPVDGKRDARELSSPGVADGPTEAEGNDTATEVERAWAAYQLALEAHRAADPAAAL